MKGLKAYRTCHSGEVASRQLFTLLNDFNVLGYSSDMISKPLIGKILIIDYVNYWQLLYHIILYSAVETYIA